MIKNDVEGYEKQVLEGSTKTLKRKKLNVIQIELNNSNQHYGYEEDEILMILKDNGFKPYIFKIDRKEISEERIFEIAIDAGANECKSNSDFHEIRCSISDIYNVKKELEREITNFISTEIAWIPLNKIRLPKEKNEDLNNFFMSLEEDDDVQNVYSNLEFEN